MKTQIRAMAALATALFVAAACDNSSTGGNSGQVNLLLTDAPFPFAEVKRVDVFVVRIDGKTAETNDTEAANESDLNGWTTLVSPNTLINLLDLTNGKTANLGVATLPTGTYRGFRLVIDTDKSSITLNNNLKPAVIWPSAGKNGIKILLDDPFVLGSGGSSSLLIDFDLGRSFVMRGNSISQNGLLFKPVIRATTQQSTGTVTGSVHGVNATGLAIAGATIELLKNGTTLTDTNSENVVRSGMTDASGNFTLAFIRPGTYVLRATPPGGSLYRPAILNGVTVTAGTVTSGQVIVVTT